MHSDGDDRPSSHRILSILRSGPAPSPLLLLVLALPCSRRLTAPQHRLSSSSRLLLLLG
jgi:hypothetical protein